MMSIYDLDTLLSQILTTRNITVQIKAYSIDGTSFYKLSAHRHEPKAKKFFNYVLVAETESRGIQPGMKELCRLIHFPWTHD